MQPNLNVLDIETDAYYKLSDNGQGYQSVSLENSVPFFRYLLLPYVEEVNRLLFVC